MNATRRLEGLGVVITRPTGTAQALAAVLEREGAHPFVFPTLAIEEAPLASAAIAALENLHEFTLAIFVSANAVEKGLAAAQRHRASWPAQTRVAGVGEATAQALSNAGFEEVIVPRERQDSDGLLALPALRTMKGHAVAIFRGEGGRERLREVLETRGARVEYVECYRRARPRIDPAPLLQAWARGEVHAVSALSAETLENFLALVGEEGLARAPETTLVVPHANIAAHPDARRFARVLVASPGAEGIVKALCALRVTP